MAAGIKGLPGHQKAKLRTVEWDTDFSALVDRLATLTGLLPREKRAEPGWLSEESPFPSMSPFTDAPVYFGRQPLTHRGVARRYRRSDSGRRDPGPAGAQRLQASRRLRQVKGGRPKRARRQEGVSGSEVDATKKWSDSACSIVVRARHRPQLALPVTARVTLTHPDCLSAGSPASR